jgi:hypothetical protein
MRRCASQRITSQPAAFSAASWISISWSLVETLAYPMTLLMRVPRCLDWLLTLARMASRNREVNPPTRFLSRGAESVRLTHMRHALPSAQWPCCWAEVVGVCRACCVLACGWPWALMRPPSYWRDATGMGGDRGWPLGQCGSHSGSKIFGVPSLHLRPPKIPLRCAFRCA